jgi:hypothetical protein
MVDQLSGRRLSLYPKKLLVIGYFGNGIGLLLLFVCQFCGCYSVGVTGHAFMGQRFFFVDSVNWKGFGGNLKKIVTLRNS